MEKGWLCKESIWTNGGRGRSHTLLYFKLCEAKPLTDGKPQDAIKD